MWGLKYSHTSNLYIKLSLGLRSTLRSILSNATEINYPRALFVRRTTDAKANRPMKDMIHWILYEELRFLLTGSQTEPVLQLRLNEFLGKSLEQIR